MQSYTQSILHEHANPTQFNEEYRYRHQFESSAALKKNIPGEAANNQNVPVQKLFPLL